MQGFSDTVAETEELIARVHAGIVPEQEARREFASLLGTHAGARAFFVALLAGESELAEQPPDWLIDVLKANNTYVSELLTKNLVMSAASQIAHSRRGDSKAAQGSRKVTQRTHLLIAQIASLELKQRCTEMRQSISELLRRADTGGDISDAANQQFLERWHYDKEQLEFAEQALAHLSGLSSDHGPSPV